MWDEKQAALQAICIQLWKAPEQARSLVEEAGIDSSQMKFDDPPAFRWQSIISEAFNQRNLDKLTPVLLSRYTRNEELQAAVAPWIYGNPKERKMPRSSQTNTNEQEAVKLTAPATIVVSTPTTSSKGDVVVTQEEEDGPEMVPVTVPRGVIKKVQMDLLASMESMKETIRDHERDIQLLKDWREKVSQLSRAEVAVTDAADAKEHKG